MITATCTWGEGPDVLVQLKNHVMICYEPVSIKDRYRHGCIKNGSADLTAKEAEMLGHELLTAAKLAKKFEEDFMKTITRE
jgi:hypothetical protein